MGKGRFTRREVLAAVAVGSAVAAVPRALALPDGPAPLLEFSHHDVRVTSAVAVAQRENVTAVLLGLQPDDLMQPIRAMGGKPAPGNTLGGWYAWKPDYDHHHDMSGLAPASTLGQWISAMARLAAGDDAYRDALSGQAMLLTKVLRSDLSAEYFAKTRFPAYTLDKLACGLVDAHLLLNDPNALPTLDAAVAYAKPSLPPLAVEREVQWKTGADLSWMWDESYTLPENLLRAADAGAGGSYYTLARQYLLDDSFFAPLSRRENALADTHAYSHVNALCSAAQMYLSRGSVMHLHAAQNGFSFLQQQSYATGGWGSDEVLRKPGYDEVFKSLTASHNQFETPCGSFAHAKLARALLRATRDGRYGDSMERVLLNTTAGVLPLRADGGSFYNADYNTLGKRVYSQHKWPCCSGTFPQVVADYGVNGYLRDAEAVWVNLYQPSEVRWIKDGRAVTLIQTTSYPLEGEIRFRVQVSRPTKFALRLRVPEFAGGGASLRVNGRDAPVVVERDFFSLFRGGFTSLERTWRDGDTVILHLPLTMRLEELAANGTPHPEVVALLRGPLVLFAPRGVGETGYVVFKGDALLKAEQTGPAEWQAESTTGLRRFVPFTGVGERTYSTYVVLG